MPVIVQFVVALVLAAVIAWLINTRVPMPASVKPIVNVVLTLIIVGMGLWLINTYVPMAGSIKAILNIVVVLATCVRVLQSLGLWGSAVGLWKDLTHHRVSG